MTEFKGNPELIAAGIRRLVKEEISNSNNPSALQSQVEELALSNFAGIGGSAYNGVAAVQLGDGKGKSGYTFSASMDVFDPMDYFEAKSQLAINDGTPYYVRKASAKRILDGDIVTANRVYWTPPVLDTAGRFLLVSATGSDGRPVLQEMLDSYLLYRVVVDENGTEGHKELRAVIAHTQAAVAAFREWLLTQSGVTEDSRSGLVTIDNASLFKTVKYSETLKILELWLSTDLDKQYELSYVDNDIDSTLLYRYYVQAVTISQTEGLAFPVDPGWQTGTPTSGVVIFPKAITVAKQECFTLMGYLDGDADHPYVTFSLEDSSGAEISAAVNVSSSGFDTDSQLFSTVAIWAPNEEKTFTVTATSFDGQTAKSTITVAASPTVNVWCYPARISVAKTKSKAFYATVYGLANKATSWVVKDANSTISDEGSISATGTSVWTFTRPSNSSTVSLWMKAVYTAPDTTVKFSTVVQATASADPATVKAFSTSGVDVTLSEIVPPPGGGGPGEVAFVDDWCWSGINVDPTGDTSKAVMELTVDITGEINKVNLWAIPIQDKMNVVFPGELTTVVAPSFYLPYYHSSFYVPLSGSLVNTFKLNGKNIEKFGTFSSSNLFVVVKMRTGPYPKTFNGMQQLSDDNFEFYIDPTISLEMTAKREAIGSPNTWFYDFNFTTRDTTKYVNFVDQSSVAYSERLLAYKYTDTTGKLVWLIPKTLTLLLAPKPSDTGAEPLFTNPGSVYEYHWTVASNGDINRGENPKIPGNNLDSITGVYMYRPPINASGDQLSQHVEGNLLSTNEYLVHNSGTELELNIWDRVTHDVDSLSLYIVEVVPPAPYNSDLSNTAKFFSSVYLAPMKHSMGSTGGAGYVAKTMSMTYYELAPDTYDPSQSTMQPFYQTLDYLATNKKYDTSVLYPFYQPWAANATYYPVAEFRRGTFPCKKLVYTVSGTQREFIAATEAKILVYQGGKYTEKAMSTVTTNDFIMPNVQITSVTSEGDLECIALVFDAVPFQHFPIDEVYVASAAPTPAAVHGTVERSVVNSTGDTFVMPVWEAVE